MVDRQVKAIVEDIEKVTSGIMVKLASSIHGELVKTTPVDTGWARANWVATAGAPFSFKAKAVKDPQPSNIASLSLKQQASIVRLSAYRLSAGALFITNNVPYINRLNHGHSKQQPPGFIQRSIDKGIRKLK